MTHWKNITDSLPKITQEQNRLTAEILRKEFAFQLTILLQNNAVGDVQEVYSKCSVTFAGKNELYCEVIKFKYGEIAFNIEIDESSLQLSLDKFTERYIKPFIARTISDDEFKTLSEILGTEREQKINANIEQTMGYGATYWRSDANTPATQPIAGIDIQRAPNGFIVTENYDIRFNSKRTLAVFEKIEDLCEFLKAVNWK